MFATPNRESFFSSEWAEQDDGLEEMSCSNETLDEEELSTFGLTPLLQVEQELLQPNRSAIFTRSGNFVFGELSGAGSAAPLCAPVVAVPAVPVPIIPTPVPEIVAPRPADHVASDGRRDETAPMPVTGAALEQHRQLSEAFISQFRREGRPLQSALVTLQALLRRYPDLVYVCRRKDGEFEVCFFRDALMKALKKESPDIVFTSFERGLKHAGLEVTQSTHGRTPVKKWAVKRPGTALPDPAKYQHKRKQHSTNALPHLFGVFGGDPSVLLQAPTPIGPVLTSSSSELPEHRKRVARRPSSP